MLLASVLISQSLSVAELFPAYFSSSASSVFFSPELGVDGNPSAFVCLMPLNMYGGGFAFKGAGLRFFATGVDDGSGVGEISFEYAFRTSLYGFRFGVAPLLFTSYFVSSQESLFYLTPSCVLAAGRKLGSFRLGLASWLFIEPFLAKIRAYVLAGFGRGLSASVGCQWMGTAPQVSFSLCQSFAFKSKSGVKFTVGVTGSYSSFFKAGGMLSFEYMAFKISYLAIYDAFFESVIHIFEVEMSE